MRIALVLLNSRHMITVRHDELGTGSSEASKDFLFFTMMSGGGKQVSSYFRQRNWVQVREVRTG